MQCLCCGRNVAVGRKAKVRRLPPFDPANAGPESAAYRSYREETAYRWAVVCPGCYARLDVPGGAATIGGGFFTMAAQSRGDRAVALTEPAYRAWQRREAEKLGLDPAAGGDSPAGP